MLQLAGGRPEALGPLYSRYAMLIFQLGAQSLDRTAAEDIVQDVFLAVWRRAETFDPERGKFRPWVLQIAHHRIVNELRRRSRQPLLERDHDGLSAMNLPDHGLEAALGAEVRDALQTAFEALTPAQRQALGLMLFEGRTHAQVAAELKVPLGTAKTRIRAGLQRLRAKLAPMLAALILAWVASLALLTVRYESEHAALQRDERALALLTASDVQAVRLTAAPGVPQATHATYRTRPGATTAVMTFTDFPSAPAGQAYQAWALYDARWTSLGTVQPDAAGSARLIPEGTDISTPPDAVQVTLEPAGGSATPSGPVIAAWQAD